MDLSIDTSESGATTELGVVGNVYVFPDAEPALVLPESVSNELNGTINLSMDFWIKAAMMTSMKSNLYGGSGGATPGGSATPAPSSPTPQSAAGPLASDSVPAIDTSSLIFSVSSAANVAQGLANNLQNIVERGIPVDQDDAVGNGRYTKNYECNASEDKLIGEPKSVSFKFEILPLPPSSGQTRTAIQIHPDGEKDGTAGCIGLQKYRECLEVRDVLRSYNNLKVKVEEK